MKVAENEDSHKFASISLHTSVVNTLKVSSASRTMHSGDYLQLKYSYQQVAHVRTSSPEHQQPVINQRGLLLKFSARTATLKDSRKRVQSGVRGWVGAHKVCSEKTSLKLCMVSGRLLFIAMVQEFWHFSHPQNCIVGDQ